MKTLIILLSAGLFVLAAGCDDSGKTTNTCGDGVVDIGEECDGEQFDGKSCQYFDFYGGELTCDSSCKINTAGCSDTGWCGDGALQESFGEECDGDKLNGETCITKGYHGGELSCDQNCKFDVSSCESEGSCGDGIVQTGESCDGTIQSADSCESLGYYGGTLSCNDDCSFNESNCATYGSCGDGVLQTSSGEDCDINELNGEDCVSLGYYGGTLSCDASCKFDTSSCESEGICGDGTTQMSFGEECDTADLNGESCTSLGYYGGTLACNSGCQFDETSCIAEGMCGDGNIQSSFGEACDSSNLNSETCISHGYHGGTLACDGSCQFDESSCIASGMCGDSIVQSSYEDCEGTDLNSQNCTDQGFSGGTLSCAADCHFDTSACYSCGDGNINPGEDCEGINLNSATCSSLGLSGTYPLYCNNSCEYKGCSSFPVVSAGRFASCGLTADGTAYCWGTNFDGQLGDNSTTTRHSPVAVSGNHTFSRISLKYDTACGITTANETYCWGYNGSGQLGDNTTTKKIIPTLVSGGHSFTQIETGANNTCGLTSDGTAYCWGNNSYGQLGDGTSGSQHVPNPVIGGLQFAQLTVGYNFTCGVTVTNQAYCWGYNNHGQLGDGSNNDNDIPSLVPGGLSLNKIAAGASHVCGLTVDGTAYCWGYDFYGQLGDGNSGSNAADQTHPIPVNGGHTFSQIYANEYTTCGITTTNETYCWGHNQYGKLGNGTTTAAISTPTLVFSGNTFYSISVGYTHNCGIAASGKTYCSGENNKGQLGNGSTTNSSVYTVTDGY